MMARWRRSEGVVLALLFCAAFALRAAYVAGVAESPWVRHPLVDSRAYHERALAILGGDWLGRGVAYQDPLYPYVLAGLYALFGVGSKAVLQAQALLDSLTVLLVYGLARAVFERRTALLAGGLAALYALCFYFDALLLKVPLTLFLISLGLLLALRADRRGRARDWLAAGLVLGVACLTRANYLLFVALLFPWLLFRRRPLGSRAGAAAAALAAGFALAVLPVTLRNYAAGGEFVLTTSQGGPNFFAAHHRANDSGRYKPPPFVRTNPAHERGDFLREAERRAGRELSPGEASAFWYREGLREIAADPAHFARHSLRKLRMFFNYFEVPDNQSYYFFRENVAPLLKLPFPTWGAILPFALVGMVLARRERPAQLLMLFFLSYLAGVVLFFNISRLRIAAVPVAIVFAAAGMLALVDGLRERRWRRVAGVAAALAVGYPLVYQHLSSDNFAVYYFNLGARRAELAERAEGADAAALRDEAERDFRHGLELRPDSALLRRELYQLLVARIEGLERDGELERALARAQDLRATFPGSADAHARVGALCAKLGRDVQARAALREALRLAPGHPGATRELERLDAAGAAQSR